MARKVKVGSTYHWAPVFLDRNGPPAGTLEEGEQVVVKNSPGCPPANTMGHCYVYRKADTANGKAGQFLGLVCTNSLVPVKEWPEYKRLLEEKRAEEAAAG